MRKWIEAGAPKEGFGGSPKKPAEKQEETPAKGPKTSAKEDEKRELYFAARAVLKKACVQCHYGLPQTKRLAPYNVLEETSLFDNRKKGSKVYHIIKSGLVGDEALGASDMWQRVKSDDMPRGGTLTLEAKALLKAWIASGAPFPTPAERRFKSEEQILEAIRADLEKTAAEEQPYRRYFSLAVLHNNRRIPNDHLKLYRAALSKLVNSLTWVKTIHVPVAIDEEEAIFRVDLRDLGWDRHGMWEQVLRAYPYGLTYSADSARGKAAAAISRVSGASVPYIRADWFVRTASRPPLYNAFLRLPAHGRDLEARLGVHFEEAFHLTTSGKASQIVRAGYFTASTTTSGARAVERIKAERATYYWRSYDFGKGNARSNLLRQPLGPDFRNNPFSPYAFKHDASEIIFALPNGLQGYLATDGADISRPEAPRDVLKDLSQTAGSPAIVNGVSCMACHMHGMLRPTDQVRKAARLMKPAQAAVEALYPGQAS